MTLTVRGGATTQSLTFPEKDTNFRKKAFHLRMLTKTAFKELYTVFVVYVQYTEKNLI